MNREGKYLSHSLFVDVQLPALYMKSEQWNVRWRPCIFCCFADIKQLKTIFNLLEQVLNVLVAYFLAAAATYNGKIVALLCSKHKRIKH